MARRPVRSRLTVRRAVVALTALALCLRLVGLGARVAHWDEARVAYWTLRATETGRWTYRPIVHGPLLQHLLRWLFPVLGASDATMRLPVALLGGLLPLAALLFRPRLDDAETVALAAVLTLCPLFVLYSRFLRSDLPLAAFAFVVVGALVRLRATGRPRYLYLAAVAGALALATKENVLLYPVAWAGAGAVVLAVRRDPGPLSVSVSRRWFWHLLLALVAALAIVVFLYAPRGPAGLWAAVREPSLWPAVVGEATVGTARKAAFWLQRPHRAHSYLGYLGHFLAVLAVGSGALVAFAVVGTLADCDRPLVAFGALWGAASVVGYPFVADVRAPWLALHALVALALPAAVGLAHVARRARPALDGTPDAGARVFLALLVVAGAQVAVVNATTNYTRPPAEADFLHQGAQPGSDLRPDLETIARRAPRNAGPDVVYYGSLAVADERVNDRPPAAANWYHRLPFPWYTEAANATVASARTPAELRRLDAPVVIVPAENWSEVAPAMDGYDAHVERRKRIATSTYAAFGVRRHFDGGEVVVFVARADERSESAE
ncbi:MAG: flippase activity-associated protein Agl23 [Haloarculaceae archaeon]